MGGEEGGGGATLGATLAAAAVLGASSEGGGIFTLGEMAIARQYATGSNAATGSGTRQCHYYLITSCCSAIAVAAVVLSRSLDARLLRPERPLRRRRAVVAVPCGGRSPAQRPRTAHTVRTAASPASRPDPRWTGPKQQQRGQDSGLIDAAKKEGCSRAGVLLGAALPRHSARRWCAAICRASQRCHARSGSPPNQQRAAASDGRRSSAVADGARSRGLPSRKFRWLRCSLLCAGALDEGRHAQDSIARPPSVRLCRRPAAGSYNLTVSSPPAMPPGRELR
jgi:hypothetical protein